MKKYFEDKENNVFFLTVQGDKRKNNIIKCEYNILMYCETGTSIVEINFKRYHITPHSTILLTYMDMVYCVYMSNDFRAKCVVFAPSLLNGLIKINDVTFYTTIKRYSIIEWNVEYALYIENLFNIISISKGFDDKEIFEQTAINQFVCFINLLKFYFQKNNLLRDDDVNLDISSSSKRDYFHAFVKNLLVSYRQSRKVSFYANTLNISSNYLNEICLSVVGRSTKDIIDYYISAQLRFDLKNSKKSMLQLAEEYNFPNQSYLSRFYRRMIGETPIETRKNCSINPLLIF